MAKNYNQLAQQQYDPSYNQKVATINNQLAQTQQGLEQSKVGVNQNYDGQVQKQNLMNTLAKNNYNNSMLSRGIGKSSIMSSGMAGMDSKNNRLVGEVNLNRTNTLNSIEAQKALANQNTQNILSQLGADRQDAIMALARQLEDRDYERSYKDKQLAMQQAAQAMEMNYRNQQMQMQREAMNASKADKSRQEMLGYRQAFNAIKNSEVGSGEKYQQMRELADMTSGYDDALNAYGNQQAKEFSNGLISDGYANTGGYSSSSDNGILNMLKGLGSGIGNFFSQTGGRNKVEQEYLRPRRGMY